MAVEVVRPHFLAEHHVVVEVDELLGEARDAVDVGLYGRGAEGGKVAVVPEDILQVREKTFFYMQKNNPISKPYMVNLEL